MDHIIWTISYDRNIKRFFQPHRETMAYEESESLHESQR